MKTLALVQARIGSSRLPGKVLADLGFGYTPLKLLVSRLRQSKRLDAIAVIIPDSRENYRLLDYCKTLNIYCYQGSEQNLLERHVEAAKYYGADVCLKIPSDCPLTDPDIVDQIIELREQSCADYASNLHPATYPDGLDVEAFTIKCIEAAYEKASLNIEREHTTPYIWDTNPSMFSIANLICPLGDFSMSHRWTLDYPEDLLFFQNLVKSLGPTEILRMKFSDLKTYVDANPDITNYNKHLNGFNWYGRHAQELKTIASLRYNEGDQSRKHQ